MNENTTKLLQQLADKLGTTADNLWRILLKQAPIDATTSLLQLILVALFGVVLYRLHKKFSKTTEEGRFAEDAYEKRGGIIVMPMIVGAFLFVLFAIGFFVEIPTIVNGFFHPEYWALNKILDAIK